MEFELNIISHRAQVLCMVGLEYLSLKFYFQRLDFPTGGELKPRGMFCDFCPCCPFPKTGNFGEAIPSSLYPPGNQTDH